MTIFKNIPLLQSKLHLCVEAIFPGMIEQQLLSKMWLHSTHQSSEMPVKNVDSFSKRPTAPASLGGGVFKGTPLWFLGTLEFENHYYIKVKYWISSNLSNSKLAFVYVKSSPQGLEEVDFILGNTTI